MLCLGAFTIAIGSLLSIKETRLKRFILYASITQVGFVILMLGTSDLVEESKSYIMTFIILYSASMLAFWGIYIILYSYFNKLDQFTNKSDSKEARNEIMISDLSGSFISNKPIAILYSILMFCLGSLPPFTGFYTKYLAMNALVNAEYFFIATFVLFMSLIAMVYYFQFITVAFVSKKEGEREAIRLNYGLEQEELSVMRITIVSFIIMLCGIELADSLEWLFSYLYTDIYGTGIF
jgi:NADH-quinone oxidoreductase subunit N